MKHEIIASERNCNEGAITENFLNLRTEESFTDLFNTFSPQLVAFFRARRCELSLAEDLAQEVMLAVYRKASQIRDRTLFRGWLFKIARNALCRHYGKITREVESVDLADVNDRLATSGGNKHGGAPMFEFLHWMAFLDLHEQEVMKLRFIEQWEYHEIAAAQSIPIGTVQWRVYNAKKKLAPHLATRRNDVRRAA